MARSDGTTPADAGGRHSAGHDAADAAWTWLERELKGSPVPALLALIGLGDGALLEALDRRGLATRVLVLEPDPEGAYAPAGRGTREAWLRSGRLVYLTDPDYAGADEAWRVFPKSGELPPVLVNPQVGNPAGVARAAQVLKKILFGVRANAEARRKFAPRYLVNSIRNVPAIAAGGDVGVLKDAYRGVPAIIAAAGPSLDNVIADLRERQHHALVIAADTALRPLLVHGIHPHLVVALDPSEMNARHLVELPACPDTWLVSESALDRSATREFDGRTLWFRVSNHEPWPWLRQRDIDVAQIDVWGSVLTGAFQVAHLAGCDPIVIVGADLSFTGNRPYARGTTYEFNWAENAASGIELHETWRAQIAYGKPTPVPDVRGGATPATKSLVSFRDWMTARIARSGRRVINATGAGILSGDGIEQLSLRDALPASGRVTPVRELARHTRTVQPGRLAAHLEAARSTPAAWLEFAGPGFDAAAVDRALDEAARELLTPTAARLQASPPAVEEIATLPERLLEFRQALLRRTNVPRATGGEAVDTLARAFALLKTIADAARHEDDMQRPVPADIPGKELLGPWCAFSERVRWRLWLFEALVGAAWTFATAASHDEDPFVRRAIAAQPADETPSPAGVRIGPANSTHACALLVLEWLMAAAALGTDRKAAAQLLSRWRDVEAALRPDTRERGDRAQCFVTVEIDRSGARDAVRLPLPLAPRDLIRRLTGALCPAPGNTFDLARLELPGMRVAVAIEPMSSDGEMSAPRARVSPRLLTDVTAPAATIAYETPHGAVVVPQHWSQSLVVTADGSVRTHLEWPAAIVGELPCGEEGAVAWGSGLANPADLRAPYVMYRTRRDGHVQMQELHARPSLGVWWQGRLYWYCVARQPGEWVGLASWAPGESLRDEAEGVRLAPMLADEQGLLLVDVHGAQFRWRPGTEPQRSADAAAAITSRASVAGWRAAARPGADRIELTSPAGRSFSMACYQPQRVAWIGRSLLVSTTERELVIFEDLLTTLGHTCDL